MPDIGITVVTCFSSAYYERCGKRMVNSFVDYTDANILVYTENTDYIRAKLPKCVEVRDLLDCEELTEFKSRHITSQETSLDNSPRKFSNKVFAQCLAAKEVNGPLYWFDADTQVLGPVPQGFLESLVPAKAFCSYLGRKDMYTETGFLGFNLSHPISKDFFTLYEDVYKTDLVMNFRQPHDCYAFDYCRTSFTDSASAFINIANSCKTHHPFVEGVLGQYFDHMKGPRKDSGFSPERRHFHR